MKILLLIGILLSGLGLLGLFGCVVFGIRIRKLAESQSHNNQTLQGLLRKLSVINMGCLSFSMLGLMVLTVAIILD